MSLVLHSQPLQMLLLNPCPAFSRKQIGNEKGDRQKGCIFSKKERKKKREAAKKEEKNLRLLFWLRLQVKQRALFYRTCRFVALTKFTPVHRKFFPVF
jgi:hypothetical protein